MKTIDHIKGVADKNSGFSLIELMVVTAIVAIIASIALPTYTQYVLRGKVANGLSGLMNAKLKMENYYQDNRIYSCTIIGSNFDSTNFTYSCATSNSGQNFTLTATGTNSAPNFVYTIDDTGTKHTSSVGTGWTGAPKDCWITKSIGSC